MKNLFYIIALLPIFCFAQNPVFVQPYSAPIYLNPAFAGYEGCSRISSSFQMSSYSFQNTISYDQYMKQLHGSFAIRYTYDNQGGWQTLNALHATYSPTFKFSDKKLIVSPAVEVGMNKYSDNGYLLIPGLMRYSNSLDLYLIPNNVLDFNGGILISHKNFVYGAAVHHITTQPNLVYNSKLPRKYTLHFSYLWEINKEHKLSPSLLFIKQSNIEDYSSSLAYSFSHIRTAIGFSTNPKFHYNGYNINLGYTNKWLRVGYTYRVIVSGLKNHRTFGTHEISFMATFNYKNKNDNRKGVELINF